MYPKTPISLALVCVFAGILNVCAGNNFHAAHVAKRQMYGGLPSVEGMDEHDANPFAAFWNQGLVPGQGFPQIGMSAYGYGLPGLGLSGFLSPDTLILEGAGHGEISNKDLDNMDDKIYGFDRFKTDKNNNGGRPQDPEYPGCFPNEDCDDADEHRYHHHNHHDYDNYHGAGSSMRSHLSLITAIVAAAVVGI
ncbi:hypothetical protein IW140_006264 [Coemansia sp. RSA 1813]|nr:hypothetical protein EV178_006172 [Coemansia sp. RSA 1646]KAJ1765756.1 hypothetical protein LPJ74_006223 [Coemansia sp. RSA 1843]KAJ2085747.1 hypothetical protein IW138_006142 [Coemansia sp. RSA 986]KAJ2211893.1 hypothetical protein EV179_005128 [Coemansia sp. RSA 487]KAJ2562961.1 hypothetical protein IW140_006264 [Coemansia sp. RSA 1813]